MTTSAPTHDVDVAAERPAAGSAARRSPELRDTKTDVKVVLSGLWVAMLFVFAYVDIFGFWRADVIDGALAREVPGPGFRINQTLLVFFTAYILIPSLMVVVSLVAPARINRRLNLAVSAIYAVTVIASMVGETWAYFIVGSVVEVALLGAVARVAWTWPRQQPMRASVDPRHGDQPSLATAGNRSERSRLTS